MFIVFFLLWILLNGRITPEIAAFGLVFAALFYAFTCKFMEFSVKKDIAFLRAFPAWLRYGAIVVREIVQANLNVIGMILHFDFEPEPQLVRFDAGLEDEAARVVYANSITLTPGTITVDLEGDQYVIHCLDRSTVEGLTDGPMISALKAGKEEQK